MELYATGLNAWNQLQFKDHGSISDDEEPDDISTFTCVLSTDDNVTIELVRPFPSYTAVYTSHDSTTTTTPKTAGLLPQTHQLLLETQPHTYRHFVEASNDIVVAPFFSSSTTTTTTTSSFLTTLYQHLSLTSLLLDNSFPRPTPLPNLGPDVIQLISFETGFAALTSTGNVYTWSEDERYPSCLGGRDITDPLTPASLPGLVPDLVDLPTGPITKISAGGYTLAALTAGNDLYVWGDAGRSPALSALNMSDRPEPVLVADVGEDGEDAEGKDVADVAVGHAHIVILTTDGEVYAIGENTNGQLGIPGLESAKNWIRVSIDFKNEPTKRIIKGVEAGPRNSFLIVQHKMDQ